MGQSNEHDTQCIGPVVRQRFDDNMFMILTCFKKTSKRCYQRQVGPFVTREPNSNGTDEQGPKKAIVCFGCGMMGLGYLDQVLCFLYETLRLYDRLRGGGMCEQVVPSR